MNTSVKVKPMPLSDRLQRLDRHYPAHPEFPVFAVRAFAETPVSVFLSAYEQDLADLACVLDIDADVLAQMTYQQLAAAIYPFWPGRYENRVAEIAISLLICPFMYIDKLPKRGGADGLRKIVP